MHKKEYESYPAICVSSPWLPVFQSLQVPVGVNPSMIFREEQKRDSEADAEGSDDPDVKPNITIEEYPYTFKKEDDDAQAITNLHSPVLARTPPRDRVNLPDSPPSDLTTHVRKLRPRAPPKFKDHNPPDTSKPPRLRPRTRLRPPLSSLGNILSSPSSISSDKYISGDDSDVYQPSENSDHPAPISAPAYRPKTRSSIARVRKARSRVAAHHPYPTHRRPPPGSSRSREIRKKASPPNRPRRRVLPGGIPPPRQRGRKLSCPDCGESFTRAADFERHWATVHEGHTCVCMACGNELSRPDAISRHKREACAVLKSIRQRFASGSKVPPYTDTYAPGQSIEPKLDRRRMRSRR